MTFSARDRDAAAWSKAVRNGIGSVRTARLATRMAGAMRIENEAAVVSRLPIGQPEPRLALPRRDAVPAIGLAGSRRQRHDLDRLQAAALPLGGIFQILGGERVVQAGRERREIARLAGELDEGAIAGPPRVGDD